MDFEGLQFTPPVAVNHLIPNIVPTISTRAESAYDVIMESIKEFENTLDDDHEVGMLLASFGQSLLLAVESVEVGDGSTLIFIGRLNDQRTTLIQSISQLNFLLMAVPKQDPTKPARRIGFSFEETDSE